MIKQENYNSPVGAILHKTKDNILDQDNKILNKKKLVINSNQFKGIKDLTNFTRQRISKKEITHTIINKIRPAALIESYGNIEKNKIVKSEYPVINQDLRSIYKLNRKVSNIRKLNKGKVIGKLKNILNDNNLIYNKNDYNEDLILLLNSYNMLVYDSKLNKKENQLNFL